MKRFIALAFAIIGALVTLVVHSTHHKKNGVTILQGNYNNNLRRSLFGWTHGHGATLSNPNNSGAIKIATSSHGLDPKTVQLRDRVPLGGHYSDEPIESAALIDELADMNIWGTPAKLTSFGYKWVDDKCSVNESFQHQKKKRAALCFYGGISQYTGKFDSSAGTVSINDLANVDWAAALYDRYFLPSGDFELDIFIHSWSETYFCTIARGFDGTRFTVRSIIAEPNDRFMNELFPMIKGASGGGNGRVDLKQVSMYFSLTKALAQALAYSGTCGFEYDLLINSRPDIILGEPFDFRDKHGKETSLHRALDPYNEVLHTPTSQKRNIFGDHFYIFNPTNAQTFVHRMFPPPDQKWPAIVKLKKRFSCHSGFVQEFASNNGITTAVFALAPPGDVQIVRKIVDHPEYSLQWREKLDFLGLPDHCFPSTTDWQRHIDSNDPQCYPKYYDAQSSCPPNQILHVRSGGATSSFSSVPDVTTSLPASKGLTEFTSNKMTMKLPIDLEWLSTHTDYGVRYSNHVHYSRNVKGPTRISLASWLTKPKEACGNTLDVLSYIMNSVNARGHTLMVAYGELIHLYREGDFVNNATQQYFDDDIDLYATLDTIAYVGVELEKDLFKKFGWFMRYFVSKDENKYVLFAQAVASCGHEVSHTPHKAISHYPVIEFYPLVTVPGAASNTGGKMDNAVRDLWHGTKYPESMLFPPRSITLASSGVSQPLELQLPNKPEEILACLYGDYRVPSRKHAKANLNCFDQNYVGNIDAVSRSQRIAIVTFGLLDHDRSTRPFYKAGPADVSLEYSVSSLNQFVIEPARQQGYEVDVFVHSWNVAERDTIINLYNPTAYLIEEGSGESTEFVVL